MIDRIIDAIKTDFNNSPDIIFRKVKIQKKEILLIYNVSLTNSSNINEFILEKLITLDKKAIKKGIYNHFYNIIPENVIKDVEDKDDLYTKIGSGFTIVITLDEKPFAIETKQDLSRGISEPLTEQSISGPKDAFTENYQTNIGLIRKRIKTNDLVIKEKTIGKQSKTKIGIFYMNNIVEPDLLKDVEKRLDSIDIDAILDSTYIKEIFEKDESAFPTIIAAERPDTVSISLLEGKICVMAENSPYGLIIPSFFSDLFHAAEDNYQSSINVTFTRLIRYAAFFIAILLPAFHIAMTTYDHEAIPVTLLINFASQREGVPFPLIAEALGLTLVFELLRESDIRMPHLSGTAISILGAIVLGDAAVAAGIVSPIMVIVIALSAISSLMFSNIGMVNAIRLWRIIFMLFASIAGIIGIFFAALILIAHLSSLKTVAKPYLYPLIPLNKNFLREVIIKKSIYKENKRMPVLTNKNYTRSNL